MPTVLVHPGGFTENGEPNYAFRERLDRALTLYYELLARGFSIREIWVVSTVKDRWRNAGKTQAEIIRDEFLKHHVPLEQIVISHKSRSSWEDVKNSFRLVSELGLPQPVISVSSKDHIHPRICLIAWFWGRRLKVQTDYVCSGPMRPEDSRLELKKTVKAILLIIKTALFGERA